MGPIRQHKLQAGKNWSKCYRHQEFMLKKHSGSLELFSQITYVTRYKSQTSVGVNAKNCKSKKLLRFPIETHSCNSRIL